MNKLKVVLKPVTAIAVKFDGTIEQRRLLMVEFDLNKNDIKYMVVGDYLVIHPLLGLMFLSPDNFSLMYDLENNETTV